MKRVLKIIAIGLVIGILLFIVNKAFNIPKDVFMNFLMICFVVVVFGSAISYVFYNYRCEKKIKASVKLLENGKAKEYIEALEVLLKNIKGSYMKNYITVSLSAGYCDLNDYEKAIELLESLTNVPLHGDLKIVQRMNLCSCYFYSHQGEKAMELYQNSQKEFNAFRKSSIYSGNIAVLDTFAAMEKGEFASADEMLKDTREGL